MERNVKKRIVLTGRLKGSALISESEGASSVALSIRGLPPGAALYSAGDGGIKRTPLKGGAAEVDLGGICALVIVKDGRTISEGFSGDCGKKRGRILAEIGIMAAGEPKAPAPEEAVTKAPGKAPEKAPEKQPEKTPGQGREMTERNGRSRPNAAVTEGILKQAEMLFSALNKVGAASGQKPAEEEGTKIPNPFPRTFPGSTWRVKDGDHRLFGEKTVNGVKRRFIAVPVDMKRSGALSRGRAVISKDGRRFLVEQIL